MIDLPAAKNQLDPFLPKLERAHHTAIGNWATFVRDTPEFALPLDATARANWIQRHICHQAAAETADMAGVRLNDRLGFFALQFGEPILMRFKYIGHGAPSNVATVQQRLLARQEYTPDMLLMLGDGVEMAPPTMVTCGYTLDGDKLGRLEIRCDCKGQQSWSFEFYGGATVVAPITLPGTEHPAKPARVTKPKRKTAHGEDAAQARAG